MIRAIYTAMTAEPMPSWRFASTDPIGLKLGNNLYTLVHCRPTIRIDPLGLAEWPVECCRDCKQLLGIARPPGGKIVASNGKECEIRARCGKTTDPENYAETRNLGNNVVLIIMNEDICWSFSLFFNNIWPHELVHADQFCTGKCTGLSRCDTCLCLEFSAYLVQARILFPGDEDMQIRFARYASFADCRYRYGNGCDWANPDIEIDFPITVEPFSVLD